jgi:hypothetical protein
MKGTAVCPHCDASFVLPIESAGKRAKCIKCHQVFSIAFGGPKTEPAPAVTLPPVPPKMAAAPSPERGFAIPFWVIAAFLVVVCLAAGYFAGREHLAYQIRLGFVDAAGAFGSALRSSLPEGGSPEKANATAEPENVPNIPRLAIGEVYRANGFNLRLDSVKIEEVILRDQSGEEVRSNALDLAMHFTVVNAAPRRILRFREDTMWGESNFRLRDDVDNDIRPVTYPIFGKPVGALTAEDDINPGEATSHIELFSTPPPRTQFLVLTVDLACFGDNGEIEFMIPASAIQKGVWR